MAVADPAALFADVPGRNPRVGEPRRLRRRGARRILRRRDERERADRRDVGSAPRACAILFHPEVVHTERGLEILRNFAFGVCGCTGDWTMASFVEEATSRIRAQVGDGRVVCALSGGVDSTVAALIIHRAIGDRLTCIFVDNGVLRLDEASRFASGSSGCSCRSCSSTRRRCFWIGWPA